MPERPRCEAGRGKWLAEAVVLVTKHHINHPANKWLPTSRNSTSKLFSWTALRSAITARLNWLCRDKRVFDINYAIRLIQTAWSQVSQKILTCSWMARILGWVGRHPGRHRLLQLKNNQVLKINSRNRLHSHPKVKVDFEKQRRFFFSQFLKPSCMILTGLVSLLVLFDYSHT